MMFTGGGQWDQIKFRIYLPFYPNITFSILQLAPSISKEAEPGCSSSLRKSVATYPIHDICIEKASQ